MGPYPSVPAVVLVCPCGIILWYRCNFCISLDEYILQKAKLLRMFEKQSGVGFFYVHFDQAHELGLEEGAYLVCPNPECKAKDRIFWDFRKDYCGCGTRISPESDHMKEVV